MINNFNLPQSEGKETMLTGTCRVVVISKDISIRVIKASTEEFRLSQQAVSDAVQGSAATCRRWMRENCELITIAEGVGEYPKTCDIQSAIKYWRVRAKKGNELATTLLNELLIMPLEARSRYVFNLENRPDLDPEYFNVYRFNQECQKSSPEDVWNSCHYNSGYPSRVITNGKYRLGDLVYCHPDVFPPHLILVDPGITPGVVIGLDQENKDKLMTPIFVKFANKVVVPCLPSWLSDTPVPLTYQLVYIVGGIEKEYYKIGKTTDFRQRFSALQHNVPFKLEVIKLIGTDNGSLLEKQLHRQYAKFRSYGEWFVFPNETVREIINSY